MPLSPRSRSRSPAPARAPARALAPVPVPSLSFFSSLLPFLLPLTACLGDSGTLSVSLTTAPDSALLDSIQRLRFSLVSPSHAPQVASATRTDGGFSLSLEFTARDQGSLAVEGFDASDALIAYGTSPPLPLRAIDAGVTIYLAPPMSMGVAPAKLAVPRFDVGVAPLVYGAIVVGGRDDANVPSDVVEVYNAYDHTVSRGSALPAPRVAPAVAATLEGLAFVVGGLDAQNTPTSTFWRFDTRIAPAGAYLDLASDVPARAGAHAVAIGPRTFLVTGPPALLDGANATVTALDAPLATLPSVAASNTAIDDDASLPIRALFAGPEGVVRYRDGNFDTLAVPTAARTRHGVVATADGRFAILGGDVADTPSADAVIIDPETGAAEIIPDVLVTPRRNAAIARAGQVIVVAGGTSGGGFILGDAEILDATTLAPVAIVRLQQPRSFAIAQPLPNGQVLLLGGIDSLGHASDVLELFTAAP